MFDDLRHSVRLLQRHAALTAAAVCTLAIAIGANTAVFSVADAVLVRPLPIHEPDRVVVTWPRERANPATIGEIAYATFRSWDGQIGSFDDLAAIGSTNWTLILQEDESVTLPVAGVSASFFPLLGTAAALGRTLLPEDDSRGAQRVAVISHASWIGRFAGDPSIVGRALRFKDALYTIVGVMPEGFDYPRGVELWVPVVPQLADASAKWDTDVLSDPGFGVLFVLGRLRRGVTLDAARDELSALMARDAGVAFRPGMEAALTPLDAHILGTTRPALLALAGCVGLILLLGCANVAVMLLARTTACMPETAVRLAIGATRWHILRQSLIDAWVLVLIGGAAGIGLAYWTIDVLIAIAPPDVTRLDGVGFDARTLGFAWLACAVTAVLVGLGPGLQASRWIPADLIGSGSARVSRSRGMRHAFVVVQVGLAIVLLVCAGLVGRSFVNLLRLDTGFDPANVLTLDVTVPDAAASRHNQFYTLLLSRVAAMTGVEAAGAVFQRPLEHAGIGMDAPILIEGQRIGLQYRDWERNPTVNFESVTPEYFSAIGTRILRGRAFRDTDTDRAPRVAIVSDRLARRLWPDQDPIGRRIHAPGVLDVADAAVQQRWPTVVGVVEDARYRGLSDPRFDLYVPYLQHTGLLVKHLMVQGHLEPAVLAQAIRTEARALEPTALVENVATMDDIVGRALAPWRFSASTLGVLGLMALALASLGVYATVRQSVVERTHEIGVRVTLGALPRDIARLVLRDGLRPTAIGLGLGIAAVAAGGRALGGLLYDVRPADPLTLAGVAALFLAVSTAASLLPTWGATRVDPVLALKKE